MSKVSDADLLLAVRQQDAAAFEALMSRYGAQMHRYLQSMVRDPMLTEDLIQEVFLRVWLRADSWDGHGSPKRWLIRIATNLALNAMRSKQRRREQMLDLEQTKADGVDEADDTTDGMLDPHTQGPEAWVELIERQERLRTAIDQLAPGKAEVMRLIYEQDLTPLEISEVLGIPPGTVRSRIHHARKQLGALWQDEEEP